MQPDHKATQLRVQRDQLDPLELREILVRLVLPEIQDPQVLQVARELVDQLERQAQRDQRVQVAERPTE